ncbi:MAG: ABC transporter substrate-binding protein [Pyrinomonadaceae bacterium]|nr:ABC transporter substrate-binding protein [Pyrinomonadaceae bacterium]
MADKFLVIGIVIGISFSCVGLVAHQKPTNEPIRVGVFLDLSGRTAAFGRATLKGVKMAAAEMNQAGGIDGRRVELIIEDDLGRPDEAAKVVERLVVQKNVHALLGEVASSNSLVAAQIAQRAKVPMITPFGTHPAVTQVGNYIFRASFIDPFQGEVLAEFAVKTLRAKRGALLVDWSSDYCKTLATAFEESLIRLGGQVVVKQTYVQGDMDFKAQLVSIKSYRPHVIFVPGYYSEAGIIAKQARQVGLNSPLLGGDGWDSSQLWGLGGTALNGSYIANQYASDNPSLASKEFVANYKALYGGLEPDSLAALGYDALKILAGAIRRAGTTDGPALREALAGTRDFEGVTGRITMDENRNALKAAVILRLQDGRFVYSETVQPIKASANDHIPEKLQPKKRLHKTPRR